MKIRAIVEFKLTKKEIKEAYGGIEPEADKLVGEIVKVKSGEYENALLGSIVSAEEIVE